MGVFAIGSLSLLSVLTSSLSATFDNRARVTAANLAAADIDLARSLDYYDIAGAVTPKVVDGRQYRVVREVAITMSSGANTSACVGSGSAKQLYKRISTRVETTFKGRAKPVRADTLVKAPVFDATSARGAIAYSVVDRNGAPLAGTPVTADGRTETTNAGGCAFFDAVVPGTHVVTAQRPGYLTATGDTVLSQSVGVTAGQISSQVLRIDRAATLSVHANVYSGSSVVSGFTWPDGVSARLATPDRQAVDKHELPAQAITPGSTRSWSAFPGTSGYDAYVGPCSQVVLLSSEPGASSSTLLPGSPVTVAVTVASADPTLASGRQVVVRWADPACSETYTFATTTGACTTTTTTTGPSSTCRAKLAVPPGSWRFEVVGVVGHTDATVGIASASTVPIQVS